jgi:Ulp1 family protease
MPDKRAYDTGLVEQCNYGDYGSTDDGLGFIQTVLWTSGEREYHTIIAKREDVKTIITILMNLNNEIITEITDNDVINEIMAVDCEYRAEVQEDNSSRKRKRRSAAALPVGENPEDNDLFLVYPTDPDAFDPITITKGCIKRLEQGEYFNDNLIDYKIKRYMEELASNDPEKRNKVHAFSCQFWIKMTEKKSLKDMYELVARWTKEIDIFALDFLFVPVNMGSHWSLSVIVRPGLIGNNSKESSPDTATDPDDKTNKPCIMFMDSLDLHGSADIARKLRSYVEFEWNVKKQKLDINTLKKQASQQDSQKGQISLDGYNFPVVKCNVPIQPNGTDCGVYVIRFVKLVLEIWPSSHQQDIKGKMKKIKRDSFDHDEITNMRLEIKGHIESIKGNITIHY